MQLHSAMGGALEAGCVYLQGSTVCYGSSHSSCAYRALSSAEPAFVSKSFARGWRLLQRILSEPMQPRICEALPCDAGASMPFSLIIYDIHERDLRAPSPIRRLPIFLCQDFDASIIANDEAYKASSPHTLFPSPSASNPSLCSCRGDASGDSRMIAPCSAQLSHFGEGAFRRGRQLGGKVR